MNCEIDTGCVGGPFCKHCGAFDPGSNDVCEGPDRDARLLREERARVVAKLDDIDARLRAHADRASRDVARADYPRLTREEATAFFSEWCGGEHIDGPIRDHGNGCFRMSTSIRGAGVSSFDYDDLTRLVFLAHERCVRVAIVPGAPGCVGIQITKRTRDVLDIAWYHPTLDEAVAKWRAKGAQPSNRWAQELADRRKRVGGSEGR